MRRTNGFRNAPDILCNGRYDTETGEVPAFEELVGSHGGLGGSQTQPFLLYPSTLQVPDTEIVGAQTLHRTLKSWARAAMLVEPAGATNGKPRGLTVNPSRSS